MARRQTRRSISVNRTLFEAATAVARDRGLPLSQLCEDAILAAIGGDLGDAVRIKVDVALATGREHSSSRAPNARLQRGAAA